MSTSVTKAAVTAVAAFCMAMVMLPYEAAHADILAKVDLSSQRMLVYVDGKRKYKWRVSTGKRGFRTKTGRYTPYAMKEFFFSQKWNMELPHTIWVHKRTAIHGTYITRKLGRPASHGCIRLSPDNAEKFYALVKDHGLSFTTVVVKK